ncbi:MAG TPA: hypothetical protein DIT04_03225, partial [Dysgonomonas sp.]|nr:hypothetical protein [Dysgonomonas sp.]
MKRKIILFVLAHLSIGLFAQVAIGKDSAPVESAVLELVSSDKGMLFPRLTTAQREAISDPADGLCVYDTDENRILHFNEK